MYSLLIADDEEMVRRGLAETIDWESLGFRVTGTARDGTEALDFLESTEVDVVLADIRMPRLSGLELAARIRVKYPEMRVVILSGYDDFEYARKAIEHDVFSYLLKPLRDDRAVEVFGRLKASLDSERTESADRERGKAARLHETLRDIVDTGKGTELIPEILEKSFPGGIIMMLDPCPGNSDLDLRDRWHSYQPRFLEELDSLSEDIIATSVGDDRMVLLIVDSESCLEDSAIEIFREIRLRGREFGDMSFTATIGSPAICPEDIIRSATEARSLLGHALYLGKNRLVRAGDIRDEGILKLPDCRSEADRFTDIMASRDEAALIDRTDSIFSSMREACPRDASLLMSWFRNFFYAWDRVLRERGFDPGAVLGGTDSLMESLSLTRTIGDMRDLFYRRALSGLEVTSRVSDSTGHRAIRYAVDALQGRYSEDIGLDSIAGELGVSPPYLSRLFKSEMDVNFKEYLTRIRLDRARELLRKTGDRIYEIAAAVGYPDQKYFCEIFKKRTGKTPREYRNEVRSPE